MVILELFSWKSASFWSIFLRQIEAIIYISSKPCIQKHWKTQTLSQMCLYLRLIKGHLHQNSMRGSDITSYTEFHPLFENSFKLDSPERFVQFKDNVQIDKASTGEILAPH